MKDIINKYAPVQLRVPLILQLAILGGSLYIGDLSQIMHPDLLKMYESMPTLSISSTLALSCLLWVVSYAVLYWKTRIELKSDFGIYWDKNKRPYCPKCKIPLGGYTETPQPVFYCHGHDKLVYIHDDKGIPIALTEAQKRL